MDSEKYIRAAYGLIRWKIKALFNRYFKASGHLYYCGSLVKIKVCDKGFCDIGNKTWLSDRCTIRATEGRVILGYNNFFNFNCFINSRIEIIIGDDNLFGPNVIIIDHNHKYDDEIKKINKQGFNSRPIHIGSDCWIGANVVICEGVSIVDHVVIGANSVVTHNIVKSGVYAGAPLRLIKDIY